MPDYDISGLTLDLSRRAILLDTNVLVAAFSRRDSRHESALYFIEEFERELLVPLSVVVESWGLLVGAGRDPQGGVDLLIWLLTPGKAVIIPDHRTDVAEAQDLSQRFNIDYVDAVLADLANDISSQCDFRPAISIATFDTSDFMKIGRKHGLRVSLYDLRSLEEYELS